MSRSTNEVVWTLELLNTHWWLEHQLLAWTVVLLFSQGGSGASHRLLLVQECLDDKVWRLRGEAIIQQLVLALKVLVIFVLGVHQSALQALVILNDHMLGVAQRLVKSQVPQCRRGSFLSRELHNSDTCRDLFVSLNLGLECEHVNRTVLFTRVSKLLSGDLGFNALHEEHSEVRVVDQLLSVQPFEQTSELVLARVKLDNDGITVARQALSAERLSSLDSHLVSFESNECRKLGGRNGH